MLAGGVMAQGAPAKPRVQHRVKFMAERLSLSAEQQSQATAIYTSAAGAESSLHASLRTAEQNLNDAVKSNNAVSMEQLASTVGTLTSQLTLARAKTQAALYQILTPEQRVKMDQISNRRAAGFGPGARRTAGESGQ
jgi:protein CpxP